ncbi:MAG: hypothetical protein ACWGN7_01850 [Thermodesulfovibrionales bacterium]
MQRTSGYVPLGAMVWMPRLLRVLRAFSVLGTAKGRKRNVRAGTDSAGGNEIGYRP